MTGWLEIHRGEAPLLVAFPHTGSDLADVEDAFVSPWLARRDGDWWVDELYAFARDLGASTVRTRISRGVIDVNRDPSGASLYPGQATTELCPTTTFDGEALYKPGAAPDAVEIARRRARYYEPYHDALKAQIARLRAKFSRVILYDCHSIRSVAPRLFDGVLPNFNIGTNNGKSCDPALESAVAKVCARTIYSHVVNGRFKGGYITRAYGRPSEGTHAIQMELACRGYLNEPDGAVSEKNWPAPYDAAYAAPMRAALGDVLSACLAFAKND